MLLLIKRMAGCTALQDGNGGKERGARGRRRRIGVYAVAALVVAGVVLPVGAGHVEAEIARATFAGGCFWCMQEPFDVTPGVIRTTVGYSGGTVRNPTYKEVTYEDTGHLEAIQVTYDTDKVDYDTLLYIFWRNIDPVDDGGQFCDRGHSYKTAIFFHDSTQERLALASKREFERSGRFSEPIATDIREFDAYYLAENYHQDYYKTNSSRYKFYRRLCRRDDRLQNLWGDEAGGYAR